MQKQESNSNISVLLVEDKKDLRFICAVHLRENGYEVEEADCAESAEGIVRTSQKKFDILITDFDMPPGMTGMDLIKRVEGLQLGFRLYVLTSALPENHAYVESDVKRNVRTPFRFLAKPFTPEEMIFALRSAEAICDN